ncbi:MAG: aldo/keto reductase [Erysipelotrichaceae bacterium]|nr:aldo/keto reductase [Erysipelotrichaceae bacterium]
MKKRTIGNTEVSAIGMGCMGFSHAEGAQTDIDVAADVIREAVDLGYTFFNTGWNYGNVIDPHHNEKILGKAFKGIRDKVVISSKCGVDFDYEKNPDRPPLIYDFSRNKVRQCVEESLGRLNTDYIDFYLQARIDPKISPEEAAETMAELIKEGKVLHWGVSEADEDYLRRANAVCPISVVENNYNIINRKHESLIPFLEENKIGWVAHGPLFKGLLTGTFNKGAEFAADDWRSHSINDDNLDKYAPLLNYLHELGEEKNATPVQLSLAWILNRKPYIVPIPGMKKKERLTENMKAADIIFSKEEMDKIDELVIGNKEERNLES